MTKGQFNRATRIRERISELKIMRNGMEREYESEIRIDIGGILKHPKEVFISVCQKRIDKLEAELENL